MDAAPGPLHPQARETLLAALQEKTLYKYLIAPINGISAGAVLTGILVWIAGP